MRRLIALLSLTTLTALFLAPEVARADERTRARRLVTGTWVSVKGRFDAEGRLRLRSVEWLDDDNTSIKAPLDGFDPVEGWVQVGPLRMDIEDDAEFRDADRRDIGRSEVRPGDRVKLDIDVEEDGELQVDGLRWRTSTSSSVTLEGPVEWVAPAVTAELRFGVLTVEVIADSTTTWTGIVVPRISRDDEDVRPSELISLGRAGFLSGEVRFDYKSEGNYDVTDALADDLDRARIRAQIEWTFPSTRHFSGMAELKAEREWVVHDDAGDEPNESKLALGETHALFSGVLSEHGSIQVGRARFDDPRDWWFREDLDSLRFFFDWSHARLEASVMQQLVDPREFLEDSRYLLLKASFYPIDRHEISVYVLDRDDWFRAADGDRRDFSPRWFGLHLEGEGERIWSYWLDAAVARGSVSGEDLRAHAWDVGVQLTFPGRWEPTLVLGYAMGTGDADPDDGTSREFRQTGLHGNNGKWNGETSFRYYGEALRPELSNIRVGTVGFGFKPRPRLSFDFAWHEYRLDELVNELVRTDAGRRRRLNLVDDDLGHELDFVFAWEGWENWEFELDVALYEPGPAFLGDRDAALGVFFKAKWIF